MTFRITLILSFYLINYSLKANPTFDQLVTEAGPLIYEKKNPAKGVKLLEKAIEINPDPWWTYSNICTAYLYYINEKGKEIKNLEKGIANCKTAIEKGWKEGNDQYQYGLARLFYEKGTQDLEKKSYISATEQFQQMLQNQKCEPWMIQNMVVFLSQHNQFKNIIDLTTNVLPTIKDQNIKNMIGRAYYMVGNLESAKKLYQKGSTAWNEIANKRITLKGKLPIQKFWGPLSSQNYSKIRLSLPLDRKYQKMVSAEFRNSKSEVIPYKEILYDGYHFAEFPIEIVNESFIIIKIVVDQTPIGQVQDSNLSFYTYTGDPKDSDFGYPFQSFSYFDTDIEFQKLAKKISDSENDLNQKILKSLEYLRANFQWHVDRGNFKKLSESLRRKKGDCFSYTYIGMGFFKYNKIPTHFLYGIYAGDAKQTDGSLNTHAILEYLQNDSMEWIPLDPQGGSPGIINPFYIPFMAPRVENEIQTSTDGIPEMDITGLWFNSGKGNTSVAIEYLDF